MKIPRPSVPARLSHARPRAITFGALALSLVMTAFTATAKDRAVKPAPPPIPMHDCAAVFASGPNAYAMAASMTGYPERAEAVIALPARGDDAPFLLLYQCVVEIPTPAHQRAYATRDDALALFDQLHFDGALADPTRVDEKGLLTLDGKWVAWWIRWWR